MARQTVNRHIDALVERVGGAPFAISAHTFRHSFAIHLLLHGLIDRLQIRRLLDGWRGDPAADLDALSLAFARFSALVAALGNDLAEIDVNPIIAGPDGVTAVDALVIPRSAARQQNEQE